MTRFVPRSRSKQLFPRLEETPDVNRGEERFAAEIALAEFEGRAIPGDAVQRALGTLRIMARA